jgi:hypothetical protein
MCTDKNLVVAVTTKERYLRLNKEISFELIWLDLVNYQVAEPEISTPLSVKPQMDMILSQVHRQSSLFP